MRARRKTEEGKESTRRTEAARKNKAERYEKQKIAQHVWVKTPKGKEVTKRALATYRKRHKDKILAYEKNRRATDPLFKLRANMRRRLRDVLRKNLLGKNRSAIQLLGCNFDFFKTYLESKFTLGMTWENYGEWELDHIYPLSKAKDENELNLLFHYKNLQPLWSEDNKRKQDKFSVSFSQVGI